MIDLDIPVHSLLRGIDTHELRASDAIMSSAVGEVASAGAAAWTGGWSTFCSTLREVARVDLCLARLVEGHADAMRILGQAGIDAQPGVYGVWASRSAGTGLAARETAGGWRLDGQLRFASGADLIDRALIPGWVDQEHHQLFDVVVEGLSFDDSSWASPAMDASRSLTTHVVDHPADVRVGDLDFYLNRPGFVAGGIGPAAVWLGGADQVADLVAEGLRAFAVTSHQVWRLGRIQQAISGAEAAIERAVQMLDAGKPDISVAVASARTAAAQAADVVLADAPVIVGPGGLSRSARLARVMADLAMYVRQHHMDSELEAAGRRALDSRRVLGA